MSTDRVRITKRFVDGLSADGTDRFLWDSDVLGFGIRISPAGKLVYVLQYRIEGRQRRFSWRGGSARECGGRGWWKDISG